LIWILDEECAELFKEEGEERLPWEDESDLAEDFVLELWTEIPEEFPPLLEPPEEFPPLLQPPEEP